MKSPRLAVLTASSLLLLGACSGNEGSQDLGTDRSSSTATSTATGDAGSSTSEAARQTAVGDDGMITAEPEGAGSVTLEEAESLATSLLTRAVRSTQSDGETAEAQMRSAFAGPALEAAQAADLLEPVVGNPPKRDLEADPVMPNVLAISRDDGDKPDLILVQTASKGELPELHLLSRPDGVDHFRIVWTAPMLPDSEVGTFDRRSVGSPVVRAGDDGFATSPGAALNALADYVDYPPSQAPELRTKGYAPMVRENADAQAAEVAAQASLSERNSLSRGDTQTLYQEDGSGITFAVLDRESRFDVTEGSVLVPPDTFTAFVDDESLTQRATVQTSVFVALRLPVQEGPVELIAAREQIVGASGR